MTLDALLPLVGAMLPKFIANCPPLDHPIDATLSESGLRLDPLGSRAALVPRQFLDQ